MSPRQARRERREAERKARKAEIKRNKVEQTILPPAGGFVSPSTPKPTRAEINRANAQHSTGPTCPEGKLASSRNSLRHGLASGTLIVPGEDPAEFEALKAALMEEHQPATETEALLVTEMAQSWWLMQRAFHKALNALLNRARQQAERQVQPSRHRSGAVSDPGFVSQNHAHPTNNPGFVCKTHPRKLQNHHRRSGTPREPAPRQQN